MYFVYLFPNSPVVQLDITVGSVNLSDQFEWDVDDSFNSPEMFAEVYASDLGLAGEFKYVPFLVQNPPLDGD